MRLNILNLGTSGVDMKSNPLLLGNKKLHAATNLVFDEGVIRTRPGFRYFKTPATGQFQGASEFRPRQGISSGTFSELGFGLVVVADGDVWFNCTSIGSGFSCKGEVNIFQAENYLIFQCFETSTFWWTGSGPLVESPGMNETDWREVETPVMELETTVPVADIPECDISSQTGGVTVIFSVVNADTEGPVEGALVTVYRNGHRAYYGMTDVAGKWTTKAVPRDYTYTVTRNGFPPVSDVPFVVLGEGEEYQWDECVPPMLVVTGQTDVNVRLQGVGEYPAVLVLVLDQTGSIGVGGAERGVEIIDNTDVQAIGYVSFGDVICQSRAVTSDLATVRAELVYAAENPDTPPFFCDVGGDIPENGVDALAAGLALLADFTDLPSGERAIFFKTDTIGYSTPVSVPSTVNAGLNSIDHVWLEFGDSEDATEAGYYATTFPETSVVSHSTFPLVVP